MMGIGKNELKVAAIAGVVSLIVIAIVFRVTHAETLVTGKTDN